MPARPFSHVTHVLVQQSASSGLVLLFWEACCPDSIWVKGLSSAPSTGSQQGEDSPDWPEGGVPRSLYLQATELMKAQPFLRAGQVLDLEHRFTGLSKPRGLPNEAKE